MVGGARPLGSSSELCADVRPEQTGPFGQKLKSALLELTKRCMLRPFLPLISDCESTTRGEDDSYWSRPRSAAVLLCCDFAERKLFRPAGNHNTCLLNQILNHKSKSGDDQSLLVNKSYADSALSR